MRRARTARDASKVRHWRIIEGDYRDAPDVAATWFVDPPYQDKGKHYPHGSAGIDFAALGDGARFGLAIRYSLEGRDHGGAQARVLDVKTGNGAQTPDESAAMAMLCSPVTASATNRPTGTSAS